MSISLEKLPVSVLISSLFITPVSPISRFMFEVEYTKPLTVMALPPLEGISPPKVAFVEVIEVAIPVITVGNIADVVKLFTSP